jgi:hypothetical protein
MAGDIQSLAFVKARIGLLDMSNNKDMNDAKHAEDRTMSPVRKYFEACTALRIARSETMSCLQAKAGRGDGVTLAICEPERFAELQDQIEATSTKIAAMESAITRLDNLIEANVLAPGWLMDLKHRIGSANSSIVQQQGNISVWAGFFTQKNKRKTPEEALADPEFVAKRAAADRLIEADKAYLERLKPVVREIEAVLSSVGC